ncbi:cardiolipin synthase [Plebeiibacterium marinum]|uniref:Cardiolipin synthase n=1 Tax=Plebeiibacterium marinum TaxID=2992111 RepID=A0AAE3SJ68_9BACT|nr:cardiolipin synthase [Plebeiobacterium marinum]MCW3805119.1 cardiolipin synthase [Plebeiobacterium marinum]
MWWSENLESIIYIFIVTAYAISIFMVMGVMILENRNPLKSLSWILVLLLLPGLGIVLYVFFGQNFRKEKIIKRKGLKNHDYISKIAHAQTQALSENEWSSDDVIQDKASIIQLQLNNSDSVVTTGNSVTLLNNGDQKFDSLIEELKKAKHFIHLQYYIFARDTIGNIIKDILLEKVKEGVKVRMIVDDVGSWELKKDYFKMMRAAGIEIYSFLEVRFPIFTSKVNYRNHRKIVVIDGYVGFVGGINVADRYIHGKEGLGKWRDTHIKIEGDAVNSLQYIFSLDWYFVSQQELANEEYFPIKKPQDNKMVQISASGPDTDWPGIMMGFFKIITTAKKYVYLATPYFMPNESVLMALKTAAMGGVDVKILIPEKSDALITKLSTMSYLKEMMLSGVKIYFYKKGFIHSKVIVSDDIVSSIGSANIDFRSFEQNFEVTSFIYDEDFAREVKQTFKDDFADSDRLIYAEWRKRPLKQKAKESLARLLSPLL